MIKLVVKGCGKKLIFEVFDIFVLALAASRSCVLLLSNVFIISEYGNVTDSLACDRPVIFTRQLLRRREELRAESRLQCKTICDCPLVVCIVEIPTGQSTQGALSL
jgi:hypothetical protein